MESWQEERIKLMRTISQEIAEVNKDIFVLKGGTALLLAHKLNRFSEDMDFDGKERVDIQQAIVRAVKKCGYNDSEIIVKKDTETTKRYSLHYGAKRNGGDYPLKIECSFRQNREINEDDVVKTDGMRVYSIEKIIEQKLNAFIYRDTARDIYDINFLLREYPEGFNEENLEKLQKTLEEKDINTLLAIYESDKQDDHILRETDGEKQILELDQSLKKIISNKNKDIYRMPEKTPPLKKSENKAETKKLSKKSKGLRR